MGGVKKAPQARGGRPLRTETETYSCITYYIADIDEYVLSCFLAVTAKELLSRRGGILHPNRFGYTR